MNEFQIRESSEKKPNLLLICTILAGVPGVAQINKVIKTVTSYHPGILCACPPLFTLPSHCHPPYLPLLVALLPVIPLPISLSSLPSSPSPLPPPSLPLPRCTLPIAPLPIPLLHVHPSHLPTPLPAPRP